jgi:hypothetical protein
MSSRRIVVGVAMLPIGVLAARAWFQDWFPMGDLAVIGLRTTQVASAQTPLVGPYSHFGWSHPGPMLYEILAAPYRVTGSTSGLLLGALLINGAAMAVIASRLYRFGGVALAAGGIACFSLVMWSIGSSYLWYPWNPSVAVLPFAALVVVAWTSARNAVSDLPLIALLGSFLAQTHVGYGPLVIILVAAALWRRSRRVAYNLPDGGPNARTRRAAILGAVILVVAWSPPLVDAATNGGGNIAELASFWTGGNDTAGLDFAVNVMFRHLSLDAPWFGVAEPMFLGAVAKGAGTVPVALLALFVAIGVAYRRNDLAARRVCIITLATVVVGIFSISSVVGFAYQYLLLWTRVIAATVWLAAAWTIVRALRPYISARWLRCVRAVPVVAAAVVLGMLTVSAATAGIGIGREDRASVEVRELAKELAKALPAAPKSIRVSSFPSFDGETIKAAVLLELERRGYDVYTDLTGRHVFGSAIATSNRTDLSVVIAAGDREIALTASGRVLLARSVSIAVFTDAEEQVPSGV